MFKQKDDEGRSRIVAVIEGKNLRFKALTSYTLSYIDAKTKTVPEPDALLEFFIRDLSVLAEHVVKGTPLPEEDDHD